MVVVPFEKVMERAKKKETTLEELRQAVRADQGSLDGDCQLCIQAPGDVLYLPAGLA